MTQPRIRFCAEYPFDVSPVMQDTILGNFHRVGMGWVFVYSERKRIYATEVNMFIVMGAVGALLPRDVRTVVDFSKRVEVLSWMDDQIVLIGNNGFGMIHLQAPDVRMRTYQIVNGSDNIPTVVMNLDCVIPIYKPDVGAGMHAFVGLDGVSYVTAGGWIYTGTTNGLIGTPSTGTCIGATSKGCKLIKYPAIRTGNNTIPQSTIPKYLFGLENVNRSEVTLTANAVCMLSDDTIACVNYGTTGRVDITTF